MGGLLSWLGFVLGISQQERPQTHAGMTGCGERYVPCVKLSLHWISELGRPLLLCTGLASQYLVSEEHDWPALMARERRFRGGHQCPWGEAVVLLAGQEALHQLRQLK